MKIKNPIFIIGCGHSGNSLMLKILGSHNTIYPVPYESQLFYKSRKEMIAEIKSIENRCISAEKKRYIEKTPKHIYKVKEILQYFPESKIIIMVRDGRDVACSIKARNKDFSLGLNRWIADNIEGQKYVKNSQVILNRYEDLVTDPDKALKKIFNFLDEYYTPEIFHYHQDKKCWFGSSSFEKPTEIKNIQDHKNFRNWQVNQPIFDGRGRWKNEMTLEEKNLFKKKAQKYLEIFGYEKDANW